MEITHQCNSVRPSVACLPVCQYVCLSSSGCVCPHLCLYLCPYMSGCLAMNPPACLHVCYVPISCLFLFRLSVCRSVTPDASTRRRGHPLHFYLSVCTPACGCCSSDASVSASVIKRGNICSGSSRQRCWGRADNDSFSLGCSQGRQT